jgi:putative ABC transport system permease protein
MDRLAGDLAFAFRLFFQRRPWQTAVAVVSLGIGIGGIAAGAGTADWLLNRGSEGVAAPNDVVFLRLVDRTHPESGTIGWSFPQFLGMRKQAGPFADLAAFCKYPAVVSDEAGARPIVLEYISGNYFQLLGVRAELGRTLGPDDDHEGTTPKAILSYQFWQAAFRGDTGVLSRRVRLNGRDTQIVGVASRSFSGYQLDWSGPTDVWLPAHVAAPLRAPGLDSGSSSYSVVGRLQPEASMESARARVQELLPMLPTASAASAPYTTVIASPSRDMRIGLNRQGEVKTFFGVLLAVCVVIFLAAVSTVGNIMIRLALLRRGEFAMRLALGARRAQLLQQLIVEAAVLTTAVTAVALVFTWIATQFLSEMPRAYLRLPVRASQLSAASAMDGKMVAIAVVLSAIAVLIGCLLPILIAAKDPIHHLRERTTRWSWAGIRVNSRQLLAGLQVALAVCLAIPAAAFAWSLVRLEALDHGYRQPGSVLVARLVARGVSPGQLETFYRQLFDQLHRTSGVSSSAIGWTLPFTAAKARVQGIGGAGLAVSADMTAVSPRFFETQGIAITAGREFGADDRAAVIINRVMADRLWPGRPAVGQFIAYGPEKQSREVIGVANEARCGSLLGAPSPCVWIPFPWTSSASYLRVRTFGQPTLFARDLRQMVRSLNPDIAVAEEISLDLFLRELTSRQRLAAAVATVLTGLAIALAIGGCVALAVSMVHDSRAEIAIRMCLGATPAQLVSRIGAQMAWLAIAGSIIGLLAGMALARALKAEFYETEPWNLVFLCGLPLGIWILAVAGATFAGARACTIVPIDHLRASDRSVSA